MSFLDQVRPPSRWYLTLESRALFELGSVLPILPLLTWRAPKGDGHPVMVLPGFMTGDFSTKTLRRYLRDLGYNSMPWTLGRNLGYTEHMDDQLCDRIDQVFRDTGKKITLIGWSLGGVYGREMARRFPDKIRQVITLGSPIHGATRYTNAQTLYRMMTGQTADDIDPKMLEAMSAPPPVPNTAIYTRTDGIVAWECTRELVEDATTQNIEVIGSHCGLGHNPAVFVILADRLAQPENDWRPMDRSTLNGFFYPDPDRANKKRKKSSWRSSKTALEQTLVQLKATLGQL